MEHTVTCLFYWGPTGNQAVQCGSADLTQYLFVPRGGIRTVPVIYEDFAKGRRAFYPASDMPNTVFCAHPGEDGYRCSPTVEVVLPVTVADLIYDGYLKEQTTRAAIDSVGNAIWPFTAKLKPAIRQLSPSEVTVEKARWMTPVHVPTASVLP